MNGAFLRRRDRTVRSLRVEHYSSAVNSLVGFVSTIIGGMGSLTGAVLGGYFVGVVSVLLQFGLPLEFRPYREAFVFASVIMVLLARPQGLFRGAETRERV